jgi:hypothetical protein
MDYSFLERLKSKVLSGAQTSAVKIEEAARTGKLHLDVMAERRKLLRAFTELGKEAHAALQEGAANALSERPGVGEMRAEIERRKQEIAGLEARLEAQGKKPR